MKGSELGHYALCVSVTVAMLAGCGGSTSPASGAPNAGSVIRAVTRLRSGPAQIQVLHRFPHYANDGWQPLASLIDVDGTLYGTTRNGGSSCSLFSTGCGTVFSITPSGTEKVLHAFTGGSDGGIPLAPLIDVGGTLYGTTSEGGKCALCGTVFSITPSGNLQVLHTFKGVKGGGDGAVPSAPLTDVNGTLYGTTSEGGKYGTGSAYCGGGCGTVYSITTSGAEKVVYAFHGLSDGWYPVAGVAEVNGSLYGTTLYGGKYCLPGGSNGCGTVYRISARGKHKVIHLFTGGSDGASPHASLTDLNGTLYGTTAEGGGSGCFNHQGCGTVYGIATSGAEQVLHAFAGSSDGAVPYAALLLVNGKFLSTTTEGGGNTSSNCTSGCGTIFSVTTAGETSVLYAFEPNVGRMPEAGLLSVNGTLYGTTTQRQAHPCHRGSCAVLFAFTP
jgi:uncharacterized repeat protein (TIGR03803 family)